MAMKGDFELEHTEAQIRFREVTNFLKLVVSTAFMLWFLTNFQQQIDFQIPTLWSVFLIAPSSVAWLFWMIWSIRVHMTKRPNHDVMFEDRDRPQGEVSQYFEGPAYYEFYHRLFVLRRLIRLQVIIDVLVASQILIISAVMLSSAFGLRFSPSSF